MTNEEYIQKINQLLIEAGEQGAELYVEDTVVVHHPFPLLNPCVPDADGDFPAWKDFLRKLPVAISTDCRCCSGFRIIGAFVLGVFIGVLW